MKRNSSKFALPCLIVSLLGILFAGIVCGAIGIVLGILSFMEFKKNPTLNGLWFTIIGFIISIADCVLMILTMLKVF